MTNYLKVLYDEQVLLMDRTFTKNASIVGSREYEMLQDARKAYPQFEVKTRTIKKNHAKESYLGLTYSYMENYILTHESAETVEEVMKEFKEMLFISKCHSTAHRYPTIKKWFLDRYKEIKQFGVSEVKMGVYEGTKASA